MVSGEALQNLFENPEEDSTLAVSGLTFKINGFVFQSTMWLQDPSTLSSAFFQKSFVPDKDFRAGFHCFCQQSMWLEGLYMTTSWHFKYLFKWG